MILLIEPEEYLQVRLLGENNSNHLLYLPYQIERKAPYF